MNSFQIAKSYAMTEISGRGACFVHGLPPRANSLVSNYKPYYLPNYLEMKGINGDFAQINKPL